MKGPGVIALLVAAFLAYTSLRLIGLAIRRAMHRAVKRAATMRLAVTMLTTALAVGFVGVAWTR